MKGNFEKSKKFRSLIKSDFNVDVVVSNLKYFIQDDLERHQKEKKTCIDFYQAWKKASNFNAFLDCLNSQNFIENNLTTASWLYSHKVLTVEVESFLCQEKCKHFITYADRGGILLTDKSNSNEMLISNHYGDGNTFIHIYENGKALLKDANPCVLHLSDVTISGECGLVTKLEKVKFTPYFLHLIPNGCNSEHDEFVKIESIQDVLDASNCNCTLIFDRYEHDQISDTDYFYFAIIEEETNEVINSFYLTGETDINIISQKLENTVQILVGHYDYKTSEFFYSEAVNNMGDQILTADETIKDEIKFLKEVASGYAARENEECRNALINFIEERKNQGLSLFETEEQKQDFINLCLSQLEE